MATLPLNLYPISYSFQTTDLMLFEAENERIKTRPLKRGMRFISVSFEFSEIEFLDFIEFFNISCDYGLLSFYASFEDDLVDVEYSFVSELDIKNGNGTDRYSVSTTIARIETDCEQAQLEFNEYVNIGIYTLKMFDMNFESTVSCNGELIDYINQIYTGLDSCKNDDNRN